MTRGFQPNRDHRVVEQLPIFCFIDGLTLRTDQLHAILFKDAVTIQIQSAVERSLPAHGRKNRVRPLLSDDFFHNLPLDRLNVGGVSHRRIRHDCRGIGVHQDHTKPFFTQRLTGLCAGVVKFAGLPDDNRACPQDKNAFDISSAGHL